MLPRSEEMCIRDSVIRTENNDPVLDENALYGYRVHDDQYGDDSVYGWLAINPENAEAKVLDSEYYMDYALTAAEYVGGYIMAVDANKELLCIKPGYWDERNSIAVSYTHLDVYKRQVLILIHLR